MSVSRERIEAITREVEAAAPPLPARFDDLDAGTQLLFRWHATREGLTEQAYLDALRAERAAKPAHDAAIDAAVAEGIARRRAGIR